MSSLGEFRERQVVASATIVEQFEGLSAANQALFAKLLDSATAVADYPTQDERIRRSAELVAESLEAHEQVLRESLERLLAAAAELDDNWTDHAGLSDDLEAADLPDLARTLEALGQARAALGSGRRATTELRASIASFARLSPECEEITRGDAQALDALAGTIEEIDLAIEGVMVTLQSVGLRLEEG